jgi:hypothetical protein
VAHGVAARLAALRAGTDGVQTCLAVRDLVVVCSSSRSGSTMFSELLRRSPDLLTFSAEINPHVTITTLGSGGSCDVVANPALSAGTGEGMAILRTELGNDLGRAAQDVDDTDFARHVAWRLTMQWPHEAIDPAAVAAAMDDGGHTPHAWSAQAFLDVLTRLRAMYPGIDPYRYDLPADAVARCLPGHAPSEGPTAEPVVEMAPFVVPRPWRVVNATEAGRFPVVTTTPRNAFRLPLLAEAFPNARIRVIHLTRNPAAAVNGLRDGWLHAGFFSCRSDEPLQIAGYTDRFPAWGSAWWNYDVPPGWRAWTDRSLVEVCGFQWAAAQRATVEGAAAIGAPVHRIAFEDIATAGVRRDRALRLLAGWLEIDPAPLADADVPVLMATAAPRPRRWTDNSDALAPVLADRSLLQVASSLGYPTDPSEWE